MIDLDSTKLTPPSSGLQEIPALPEPEGTVLKNHLKQVTLLINSTKIINYKTFKLSVTYWKYVLKYVYLPAHPLNEILIILRY